MQRSKLFVVAFLAVLAIVFAVSSPSHAYFGGKVGAFLPNGDDEGLEDFDAGFNIEAFYGYEISPPLVIEAAVGYYRTEYSDFDPYYGVNVDSTVSAIPVTLTAKGSFPVQENFSLYAGAGVGIYLASADLEGSAGYLSVGDDDSSTAFGFHFVAGAEYGLGNGMAVLGEFKWFTAEPEFTLFDEDFDVKIGGIALNIGLKF